MEIFNIEIITKKPQEIYDLLSYEGRITIGDFSETFAMPLTDWSIKRYENQWKNGLKRLIDHNYSCLVVTVQNLKTNPLIEMWPLYKDNKIIFLQNHLLNSSMLKEINSDLDLAKFNEKTYYEFITYPREIYTEQGNKASEWSISADDFFASVKDILKR